MVGNRVGRQMCAWLYVCVYHALICVCENSSYETCEGTRALAEV